MNSTKWLHLWHLCIVTCIISSIFFIKIIGIYVVLNVNISRNTSLSVRRPQCLSRSDEIASRCAWSAVTLRLVGTRKWCTCPRIIYECFTRQVRGIGWVLKLHAWIHCRNRAHVSPQYGTGNQYKQIEIDNWRKRNVNLILRRCNRSIVGRKQSTPR